MYCGFPILFVSFCQLLSLCEFVVLFTVSRSNEKQMDIVQRKFWMSINRKCLNTLQNSFKISFKDIF